MLNSEIKRTWTEKKKLTTDLGEDFKNLALDSQKVIEEKIVVVQEEKLLLKEIEAAASAEGIEHAS